MHFFAWINFYDSKLKCTHKLNRPSVRPIDDGLPTRSNQLYIHVQIYNVYAALYVDAGWGCKKFKSLVCGQIWRGCQCQATERDWLRFGGCFRALSTHSDRLLRTTLSMGSWNSKSWPSKIGESPSRPLTPKLPLLQVSRQHPVPLARLSVGNGGLVVHFFAWINFYGLKFKCTHKLTRPSDGWWTARQIKSNQLFTHTNIMHNVYCYM